MIMEPTTAYRIADVLAVARKHPFYDPNVQYPPDRNAIQTLRADASTRSGFAEMKGQPLLQKKSLYSTIQRLVDDTSQENTFRRSVYISTTGGGSGGRPLFFATDVNEQRRQRALFGSFLNKVGFLQPEDWVLTLHTAGKLYRSLDLTLETFENAQASVLSGGSFLSPDETIKLLTQYKVNVLTGDGGQVVETVHHISKLPAAERTLICLNKLIYTSEPLTTTQRRYVRSVLGSQVLIGSVLGSAEAGPYAVSLPGMETTPTVAGLSSAEEDTGYTDFLYDTRTMFIEIFPMNCLDDNTIPVPVPEGELGLVSQTSLTRLRNPLVRYMTGDVASLHAAPPLSGNATLTEDDKSHLRVLRLRGRDPRFSFSWAGEYFDFGALTRIMATVSQKEERKQIGDNRASSEGIQDNRVLQWQVILEKLTPSNEAMLEVRVLMTTRRLGLMNGHKGNLESGDYGPSGDNTKKAKGREVETGHVVERLRAFFNVDKSCERRMRVVEVDGLDGFERSATGKKVVKFIDRFTD